MRKQDSSNHVTVAAATEGTAAAGKHEPSVGEEQPIREAEHAAGHVTDTQVGVARPLVKTGQLHTHTHMYLTHTRTLGCLLPKRNG
jgi:hypothetical protein